MTEDGGDGGDGDGGGFVVVVIVGFLDNTVRFMCSVQTCVVAGVLWVDSVCFFG